VSHTVSAVAAVVNDAEVNDDVGVIICTSFGADVAVTAVAIGVNVDVDVSAVHLIPLSLPLLQLLPQ
jgi:hypothetical protein